MDKNYPFGNLLEQYGIRKLLKKYFPNLDLESRELLVMWFYQLEKATVTRVGEFTQAHYPSLVWKLDTDETWNR